MVRNSDCSERFQDKAASETGEWVMLLHRFIANFNNGLFGLAPLVPFLTGRLAPRRGDTPEPALLSTCLRRQAAKKFDKSSFRFIIKALQVSSTAKIQPRSTLVATCVFFAPTAIWKVLHGEHRRQCRKTPVARCLLSTEYRYGFGLSN